MTNKIKEEISFNEIDHMKGANDFVYLWFAYHPDLVNFGTLAGRGPVVVEVLVQILGILGGVRAAGSAAAGQQESGQLCMQRVI